MMIGHSAQNVVGSLSWACFVDNYSVIVSRANKYSPKDKGKTLARMIEDTFASHFKHHSLQKCNLCENLFYQVCSVSLAICCSFNYQIKLKIIGTVGCIRQLHFLLRSFPVFIYQLFYINS